MHGLTVVPIPGTRKRSRVEENTAATRIRLTDGELALLEPIAAQVSGGVSPTADPAPACLEILSNSARSTAPR